MREKVIDASTLSDLLHERAAILEYDARLPRKEAEAKTALMYGFETWQKAMEALGGNLD